MALFGKKQEIPPMDQAPMTEQNPVPIDLVIQMRQQGLTNNQVIQNLQREGYSSDQIFDAISQADVKGGVEAVQPDQLEPLSPMDNPISSEPYDQSYDQSYEQPVQYSQYPVQGNQDVERIAEAIINEKWQEVAKDMAKLHEWKEQAESQISKIQQSILDLKNDFEKLHQALIGKITEYDQNILNVGTEIKAMEKVFQKVIPQFTQNINDLERLTKRMKK